MGNVGENGDFKAIVKGIFEDETQTLTTKCPQNDFTCISDNLEHFLKTIALLVV